MKSRISMRALAVSVSLAASWAAQGVTARPGLAQQYPPGFAPQYAGQQYGGPEYAGQQYPGAEPSSMMAPSPYAGPNPYANNPYGASFGVAPAGFRQPPPNGAYPDGALGADPGMGAPPAMHGTPGETMYEGGGPGEYVDDHSSDGVFADCACESCGGGGCDFCRADPRHWGGISYFVNWRSERTLPPLVTTSPVGTGFAAAGLLPNANILVGGDVGNDDALFGGRAFAGFWLDELHEVAIGGSMWTVEEDSSFFTFNSDGTAGSPILAQPFISTLTGLETRAIVAFPGFSSGDVTITENQFNNYGGDLFILTNWNRTPAASIDLLAGYVTARMDDIVTIDASRVSIAPNGPPPFGSTLDFTEFFHTQNEFHGGELGLATQLKSLDNRWSFNLTGKCGFGGMTQRLRIRGTTVTTVGGVQTVTDGGLFSQPTNIGDFAQTRFAVAPEVEARMNYWFTPNIGISFGYQLYYWSSVAMAGDQIDRRINPTQFGGGVLVGEARPRAIFDTTDFWIQGMTGGLVVQF